tara:strand:+ start:130 stop:288 length:159 start_codon:yes stop_codon:yes gene_type:complete
MKVGDLVVQVGYEVYGTAIIMKTWADRYATVMWPGGELTMLLSDLEVVSESR